MVNFLTTTDAAAGTVGSSVIMMVLMLAVMYFLLIRPENKRKKEAEQMRASVRKGDKITTIGGIIGKVVSIKEETLVLETSHDRTRIRILKTAVSRVDVKAEDAQD